MYDLGVYAASFVQRMTGRKPEKISAVSSFSEEGIDTYTTVVFEYADGMKAHIDCGMVLETEKNCSLDRFQIHGSKGSLTSVDFGFNAPGRLSYRLRRRTSGYSTRPLWNWVPQSARPMGRPNARSARPRRRGRSRSAPAPPASAS